MCKALDLEDKVFRGLRRGCLASLRYPKPDGGGRERNIKTTLSVNKSPPTARQVNRSLVPDTSFKCQTGTLVKISSETSIITHSSARGESFAIHPSAAGRRCCSVFVWGGEATPLSQLLGTTGDWGKWERQKEGSSTASWGFVFGASSQVLLC